jgi:hypothetical protein
MVCAVVSGLIYLFVFTLPFRLSATFDIIPPVDYAKLTNYAASRFLAYIFGVVALFGLYIWAFLQLRPPPKRPNISRRVVFGGAAGFALILIFSYPLTAIDLFIYSIRSRSWALYGLPPLSTPPDALPPADPWLGLAGEWVDAASPYGPLWEWLSLAAFYISRTDFLAHLFLLKLIGAAAYLGCAWLIFQTLQRLRPSWALAGTLAFAWNPLILFESVQNAHNDILLAFFLLAAIWMLSRQLHPPSGAAPTGRLPGDVAVCLLLAASILVKFMTAAIAPFFLLALASRQPTWPRRWAALLGFGSLMAVVVIVLMWPVWPGWQNWAVLDAGNQAGRSVLALAVLGLRGWLGTNTAFDASRAVVFGAVSLIYLINLWRTARQIHQPMPVTVPVAASFYVLFWYVLLAMGVFHAWYLLWFVPLASLLLPQPKPLAASIVFSLTALLAIPYFETVRVWVPLLLQNHFLGHLVGVPLLVLPPAVTLLWPIRPQARSEV